MNAAYPWKDRPGLEALAPLVSILHSLTSPRSNGTEEPTLPALSPYEGLPAAAFWRNGVQHADPRAMFDIYSKRFSISPTDRVMTAGSCFAQHIARHLQASGFTVLDAEPPPEEMPSEVARAFGYKLYSARYGNIYTARQLYQLLAETLGHFKPANPVWEKHGRFFDAMRPSVEPEGLDSPEEVLMHRAEHLRAVRWLVGACDVVVFTLGLTEAWMHRESGTVYPTAPGTLAGSHDPELYEFKNFTFDEVRTDFLKFRTVMKRFNPSLRFLLTVSPVPLTATAAGRHVLQSSTYSKAVLRAVAGQLHAECEDVDYFPSYEIITNPAARSEFFEPNLRSVDPRGVESVMRVFFNAHGIGGAVAPPPAVAAHSDVAPEADGDDVVCEEMLLEAFAGSAR